MAGGVRGGNDTAAISNPFLCFLKSTNGWRLRETNLPRLVHTFLVELLVFSGGCTLFPVWLCAFDARRNVAFQPKDHRICWFVCLHAPK